MASADDQPDSAAPRLSLAARKNVRENWEPEKIKLEQKLQDLLGVAWVLELDAAKFNQVLSQEGSDNTDNGLSDICTKYATKAFEEIENWVKVYLGADELNELFPNKILRVDIGDEKMSDSELTIKESDGALSIKINATSFDKTSSRRNKGDRYEEAISDCCNKASPEKDDSQILFPETRRSIRAHYDPKIEEVREKFGRVFAMPDIKIDPNFEQVFKAGWYDGNWPSIPENDMDFVNVRARLGAQVLMYFEVVLGKVEKMGFGSDTMLCEGFHDLCPSHEIGIKVVTKKELQADKRLPSYNNVVFEDGKLWLRTCPEYWCVNVLQMGEKLIDIM